MIFARRVHSDMTAQTVMHHCESQRTRSKSGR